MPIWGFVLLLLLYGPVYSTLQCFHRAFLTLYYPTLYYTIVYDILDYSTLYSIIEIVGLEGALGHVTLREHGNPK